MSFAEIPAEIAIKIFTYVAPEAPFTHREARQDLFVCTRVCRWWRAVLSPFLWKDISISFIDDTMPTSRDGLVGFTYKPEHHSNTLVLWQRDAPDMNAPRHVRDLLNTIHTTTSSNSAEPSKGNDRVEWTVDSIIDDPDFFFSSCITARPILGYMLGVPEPPLYSESSLSLQRRARDVRVEVALAKTITAAQNFFTQDPNIAAGVQSLILAPHRTFPFVRFPHRLRPANLLQLVSCFPNLERLRLVDVYFDLQTRDGELDWRDLASNAALKEVWVTFPGSPNYHQNVHDVFDALSILSNVEQVFLDDFYCRSAEDEAIDVTPMRCRPSSITIYDSFKYSYSCPRLMMDTLALMGNSGSLNNFCSLNVSITDGQGFERFARLLEGIGHQLENLELGFVPPPASTRNILSFCTKLTTLSLRYLSPNPTLKICDDETCALWDSVFHLSEHIVSDLRQLKVQTSIIAHQQHCTELHKDVAIPLMSIQSLRIVSLVLEGSFKSGGRTIDELDKMEKQLEQFKEQGIITRKAISGFETRLNRTGGWSQFAEKVSIYPMAPLFEARTRSIW